MVPAAFGFWVIAQLALVVYVFIGGGLRNGVLFLAIALLTSYLWHFVTRRIPHAFGLWAATVFHVAVLFFVTRWLVR